jgi:hypothetical protein
MAPVTGMSLSYECSTGAAIGYDTDRYRRPLPQRS